jgi:5,10-methylene-tetrahydrofolate dehydrogenase/methenyl tetrahydrofolate cyclohydrolase
MTARIIDGKAVAAEVRARAAEDAKALVAKGFAPPGLATVLVGSDPASEVYVGMKQRMCEQLGIESFGYTIPADSSQEEVEKLVKDLNDNPLVNGILVQLPLPSHLDDEAVLRTISVEKDVDGFHPINMGRLAQKGREPLFVPCTPDGCMYLALLLVKRNATVTICHSRTRNLPEICAQADILIAAVGRAEMVKKDWVKPGAAVIDVGTHRIDDASREKGYYLTGDVAFDEVSERAGFISPSPGGVGPMTIAMLMRNTVRAAYIENGLIDV